PALQTRAESPVPPPATSPDSASLIVTVRGPSGELVSGAGVSVDSWPDYDEDGWRIARDGPPLASSKTDAGGRAALGPLTTGSWCVTASAPGYAVGEAYTKYAE